MKTTKAEVIKRNAREVAKGRENFLAQAQMMAAIQIEAFSLEAVI
jgi:hypothetical protein